jgi:hypothetical protein
MALGESLIRLRHGTTRQRAETIIQNGPDPNFVEPGGCDRAEGFSTTRIQHSYPYGSPDDVAAGKARLFPNEGGAAIIEIEVPEPIVQLADIGGEVRFRSRFWLGGTSGNLAIDTKKDSLAMNAGRKIRDLVTAHLSNNPNVDGVQFIDHLLSLTFEVGEIECRLAGDDNLRFCVLDRPVCEVVLNRAKAKLRLLCARLGVLCRESGAPNVSLFGGEGIIRRELAMEDPSLPSGPDVVRTGATSLASPSISGEWKVRFKNTPSEQEFTIQPAAR